MCWFELLLTFGCPQKVKPFGDLKLKRRVRKLWDAKLTTFCTRHPWSSSRFRVTWWASCRLKRRSWNSAPSILCISRRFETSKSFWPKPKTVPSTCFFTAFLTEGGGLVRRDRSWLGSFRQFPDGHKPKHRIGTTPVAVQQQFIGQSKSHASACRWNGRATTSLWLDLLPGIVCFEVWRMEKGWPTTLQSTFFSLIPQTVYCWSSQCCPSVSALAVMLCRPRRSCLSLVSGLVSQLVSHLVWDLCSPRWSCLSLVSGPVSQLQIFRAGSIVLNRLRDWV